MFGVGGIYGLSSVDSLVVKQGVRDMKLSRTCNKTLQNWDMTNRTGDSWAVGFQFTTQLYVTASCR